VAAGGLLSLGILATALPVSALLAQRGQIAATSAQLAHLRQQNEGLTVEHQQLTDTAEVGRLAREQYQLVTPGQSLFTILPASGTGGSPAAATDPGLLPPVAPADAPGMAPDPGLPVQAPTGAGTNASAPSSAPAATGSGAGFWRRVEGTLEFWR
jgi:hypothetical protein